MFSACGSHGAADRSLASSPERKELVVKTEADARLKARLEAHANMKALCIKYNINPRPQAKAQASRAEAEAVANGMEEVDDLLQQLERRRRFAECCGSK
jgi:hypothetical protein